MLFFVANDGTVIKGMPSPVYQGAANTNTIYLIAPFATNTTVTVAFQLPNGTWTSPSAMTSQDALSGIVNQETGQTYAGWTYDIPSNITQYYGTVTAQFFFYSAQAGVITATSATSFQVGRGVPAVLPDTPTQDIYEQILSNFTALQTQLNNGTFTARSIYAWNSSYTYGANEITFYPSIGEYGAFVQSVQTGNTNNTPYINGAINSTWWKEIVNFSNITEDYLNQLNTLLSQAQAAQTAAENAQTAAENAEVSANSSMLSASASASASATSATQAAESATQAAQSKYNADVSAINAQLAANSAQSSATAAEGSAQAASNSALQAQGYMEQAKQYAQKEYQIYDSFSTLPIPGDSAFIYLVPSTSGGTNDGYSEYLWITEDNKYEFIGTTGDINLSNYAQINGTYPNMTVGKAVGDGNGNNIVNTYAAQDGNYPNLTVGKAVGDGNGNNIINTYAKQDGSYPAMSAGALARMGVASGNNTQEDVGWWKLGEVTAASLTNVVSYGGDYSILFLFNGVSPMGSTANYAQSGMVELDGRVASGAFVVSGANQLKILSGNLEENDVAAVWSADKIELYCNLKTTYSKQAAVVLSEIIHTSAANCFAFAPSYASASLPSGAAYAVNVNQSAYAEQASNAATATDSEKLGGVLATEYALQTGTYSGLTAGQAVADGDGNNIINTYATKSEIPFGFEQIDLPANTYHQLEDGYVYMFNGGITNSAGFEITDSVVTYTIQAGSIFVKLNGPSSTILYRGFNGSATPSEVSGLSVSQANYTGSGGTWYWGIKTTYSAGGKLYRMKLS